MNIFEQYGIKEVANCTLYAIDLDKYDNEIYIPIMYLDTLKVSTVEQATEQSTARGGPGNPKLIGWDYGKDITVTLEDALYTPASQSLMWGGKFGIKKTKIYGVWNPCVYPVDKNGRPIYLIKQVATPQKYSDTQTRRGIIYPEDYDEDTGYPQLSSEEQYFILTVDDTLAVDIESADEITKASGWKPFTCCQDGKLKYYRYVLNNCYYKYIRSQDQGLQNDQNDQMPKIDLKNLDGLDIFEDGTKIYGYSVQSLIEDNSWTNTGRPEIAELIIDNYGDFSYTLYNADNVQAKNEKDEDYLFANYTPSNNVDLMEGNSLGYRWYNVDMKMISLEGGKEVHYLKNASYEFKTPLKRSNKIVSVAQQNLYKTAINKAGNWEIIGEPITEEINLAARLKEEKKGYAYKLGEYSPKIDFYAIVTYQDPMTNEEFQVRVKRGTFYIIIDWNIDEELPHDSIWPIEEGLDRCRLIDRMERCWATHTFAIDTDVNLLHSSYRNMKEYEQSPLTVYINPKSMKPYHPNSDSYKKTNGEILFGNYRIIRQGEEYYKWTRTKAPIHTTIGHSVVIDPIHFPGTYRLVGETYTRNRDTGRDKHYQFEIPLAKMSAENNLTLQADGDPTTFTMKLTALKRDDNVMMKLTTYTTDCNYYGDFCSGSTKVIPTDSIEDPALENVYYYDEIDRLKILYPSEGELYEVSIDNTEELVEPIVGLEISSQTRTVSFDKTTLGQSSISVETVEKVDILTAGKDYTIDIVNNQEEEATE